MLQKSIPKNTLLRIVYFTIAGVLLLVSGTVFWLHSTFYNTKNFTAIATTAITKESSRQSIARKVVDATLDQKPLLRSTVGPKLEGLITNVLGSNLAERSFRITIENIQILLTTPQKPPIVLDLRQVKPLLNASVKVAGATGLESDFKISDIPDSIKVLDTAKIPNFYSYSIWLLWIGPLTFGIASSMLLIWIRRGGQGHYLLRSRIVLLVVAATAVVSSMIGPLVKPSVLSVAKDAPTQSLLGALYSGFVGPYAKISVAIGLGAIVCWFLLLIIEKYTQSYRVVVRIEKKKIKKVK